jgi:hypothetical protein
LVNELDTTGSLLDEKRGRKLTVLTEEKWETGLNQGIGPQNFYNFCIKTRCSSALKKHDPVARLHPEEVRNNILREISTIFGELQRVNSFYRLYSVHSCRRATFSASTVALVRFCLIFYRLLSH